MPLSMMKAGEPGTIKRIGGRGDTRIHKVGGREETRRFLENLGFVAGSMVTVISHMGGNIIVNVKDSRIAIGKDMANKILV